MAKLNILQNHFDGKLGQVVGFRWLKKWYARSAPFGVSPHNTAQKTALSNFGQMQRILAPIVKKYTPSLIFNSPSMTKLNLAVHQNKDCLADNFLDWKKWAAFAGTNEPGTPALIIHSGPPQKVDYKFVGPDWLLKYDIYQRWCWHIWFDAEGVYEMTDMTNTIGGNGMFTPTRNLVPPIVWLIYWAGGKKPFSPKVMSRPSVTVVASLSEPQKQTSLLRSFLQGINLRSASQKTEGV